MYASIMRNEIFPFDKARFLTEEQIKKVDEYVKNIEKLNSWRDIYNLLTRQYGLFIAEVDFEENPMNLEPVIQYKYNGKTTFTVERRTDIITSVDIALVI